jgi:hypothetical protein
VHRQLPGPGPEEVAVGADDVADVDQAVKREVIFRNGVLLNVDLQALAVLKPALPIRRRVWMRPQMRTGTGAASSSAVFEPKAERIWGMLCVNSKRLP